MKRKAVASALALAAWSRPGSPHRSRKPMRCITRVTWRSHPSVGAAAIGVRAEHQGTGPQIYAHEIYALDGAIPGETFTVTNNFHLLDPGCDAEATFSFDSAVMSSNAAGKRADAIFTPADRVLGRNERRHLDRADPSDVVGYTTACSVVVLD